MLRVNFLCFVSLIALTRAVDLSGLPSCGKTCATSAISSQTTCSTTDTSCLCGDNSVWYNMGYCLGLGCDSIDQSSSLEWIARLCSGGISGGGATATAAKPAILTAISTSGLASSPTSTGVTYQTQTQKDQNQGAGGLSSGAKIGLGVGIPLAVIVIAGGILLAFLLGRRKSKKPANDAVQPNEQGFAPGSQQQYPINGSFAPAPAHATVMAEKMGMQPTVQEMYPPQPTMTPQPNSQAMYPHQPVASPNSSQIGNASSPPPAYSNPPQMQSMAVPMTQRNAQELSNSAPPVVSQGQMQPQMQMQPQVYEAPTSFSRSNGPAELPGR